MLFPLLVTITMKQLQRRLYSIDVFRAITMFLMIFVNDFDGVKNVPEWVGHAPGNADALGFADVIFPTFLLIVGLSIPFAIKNRISRGQTTSQVFIYILLRSLALLVMGVFHVNLENYSSTALLPRDIWEILITVGFFLIWIDYPETMKKNLRTLLQVSGILLLAVLAFLYKGETEEQHLLVNMRLQWYGILGLIGWSYFICASIFLFTNGKLLAQLIAWILFFAFTAAAHSSVLDGLSSVRHHIWIVGNGAMPALTMAGVFASVLYSSMAGKNKDNIFWLSLVFFGIFNIVIGFITRPLGGISKIHDTPAWVGICSGIALLVFALLIYIVDIKEKKSWFSIISPAGTSTLTCYLIPYVLYSLYSLLHIHFPAALDEGWGGFARSIITSFVVIFLGGLLQKIHIKLKV